MTFQRSHSVTVTTDGAGAATAFLPVEALSGRIAAIEYVKVDYSNGVTFTITLEKTGEGLWTENPVNASKIVYPTIPVHNQVGVAQTPADFVRMAMDRVKIVIASGGATKSGTFILHLE